MPGRPPRHDPAALRLCLGRHEHVTFHRAGGWRLRVRLRLRFLVGQLVEVYFRAGPGRARPG